MISFLYLTHGGFHTPCVFSLKLVGIDGKGREGNPLMLCRRILMGLSWLVSNTYPSSRVHVQRTAVGLPSALDVKSGLLAWPPLALPSALCRALFFLEVSGPSRLIAPSPPDSLCPESVLALSHFEYLCSKDFLSVSLNSSF